MCRKIMQNFIENFVEVESDCCRTEQYRKNVEKEDRCWFHYLGELTSVLVIWFGKRKVAHGKAEGLYYEWNGWLKTIVGKQPCYKHCSVLDKHGNFSGFDHNLDIVDP